MMFRNNNPGESSRYFPNGIAGLGLLALLLLSTWVQAAAIHVETDRNNIAVDENFQIIFSVEGDVDGSPDFSLLDKDFEVLGTSQSRSISIVNGKASRTTRYLVNVLPRRSGKLTIPSISFGADKSPQTTVLVTDNGVGAGPTTGATDTQVFLQVSVDEDAPYVQQQVILTVRIFSSIQWREASLSEPAFRDGEVLVQKLGEDRSYQKQLDGKAWRVIERRYALFPQQSGEIKMRPMSLNLRIPDGRKKRRSAFGSGFNDPFFDDFFSSQSYRNKVIRSKALTLKVKAVPPDFSGSRWLIAKDLRLEENWSEDLADLKVGEPVTRTVAIIADGVTLGQLPDISMPDVDGLRIYPDDPVSNEQATANGVLSTSSRKFAIIPVSPGSYRIPALELKWWNSKTGKEETAKIAPQVIEVGGVAQVAPPLLKDTAVSSNAVDTAMEDKPQAQAIIPGGAQDDASMNRWLLLSSVVFLGLWLLTLFAWVRSRHGRPVAEPEQAPDPSAEVNARAAWKALHESAKAEDPQGLRQALLRLAPIIWKQQPPTSLEAMAALVDEPLSLELLELSRELYAGEKASWSGQRIEQGLKSLEKHLARNKQSRDSSVLRPMYPQSMHY